MAKVNRQWILKKRPVGEIGSGDLALVETPIPALGPNQFLARTVYLSLDPTNRIWMSDMTQYMPPVELGAVMRGGTLSVVEESNHPDFKPGDIVSGIAGWQEYSVENGGQKLPRGQVPLSAYMSVLGATGATAYFGLLDIGKPKAGETVVVSAAAGAVGSIVGQIAKLKGCRVVGLAGSDEKCRHVVKDFGFDACINYKTEDVSAALKRECPNGIDVDFENAGGTILDAVLENVNLKARIALCGLISTYNAKGPVPGPYNFANILMKRVTVEGFIVIDFFPRFGEFQAEMAKWVAEGKVKHDVHVVKGIENALSALNLLFTGGNTGKLLLQLSEEP
ncbi:MAG: NADP-dependent oxidoreductase [Alphaproteobacteria bacterium]|jgi:NADPH-dependent curcumin reductase CurA|nr:NADP-dependent oxidoreductase [Alphaproteobacteria bacterium]MBN9556501.1 NADP-dependent oxidoreductase [Alphaproteobacteria bacterium]MBN9578223.1 NADP-dependent oxidoreductase [Alphaproteobacteria bacterium]MBN9591968.1 NADP-dependent oxidoreductase [Alphaproteobacteria bacterium]